MTIVVFLLVVTGYQQFVVIPRARQAQRAAQEQLKQQQGNAAAKPAILSEQTTGIVLEAPSSVKPEKLTTLSLPHADITFSSKGAGIKTYLFKDVLGDVDLTPYEGTGYFATLPQVDFTEAARTKDSITFTGDLAAGVTVSKKYTFSDTGIHHIKLTFTNNSFQNVTLSDWSWNFGPGLATVKSEMSDNERESKAVYVIQEKGKKNPTLKTLSQNTDQSVQGWIWAGIENRYFLTALIPQEWKSGAFAVEKEKIGLQKRLGGILGESELMGPRLQINVPSQVIAVNTSRSYESDFYFGPKDYNELQKLPYHLDRSIEFGFFGALGKIARRILDTFYGWTGNYGVAIIMITILIQALLFKVTVMQYKTMAKMKKLQPEMAKIQAKYKDNAQELNLKVMELYRKHGVNPLSGCLPILFQMPIFIALYNALRTSWSLHGAKFALWITDLSSKDPYYILPILMGAVMFFQQRSNASVGATDPVQANMIKYMPIIFTLLFMNFPSGLVLYWLTNSLISFGIQTFINKKLVKAS